MPVKDDEILTTNSFFQDAFGIGVTHGTKNKIDLPSTYNFSTERYLLLVNGSRANPGETAFTNHFTDQPSSFDLEPDAGDTVELRIRERPRYVPGFEILYGIAWYMSSSLPSGGVVKVGLRDPESGNQFKVEYTDSSAEAVIEKRGSETVRQDVTDGWLANRDGRTIQQKLQQPQIDRHLCNMYGVGGFKPGKSYLSPVDTGDLSLGVDEANVQHNENLLAEHIRANGESVPNDVGVGNLSSVNTEEFNMHLSIEIDLSSASSAATLSALSKQYVVLGDVSPTTRPKPLSFFDLGGSIGAGWNDGIMALRTDPTQENVDVDMTILGITPTVDMEVVAMAFDPADLAFTDANFAPVQEQAAYDGGNTVLQANAVDAPFSYPTRTYTDPKGNDVTVPDKGRLLNRATETAGSNQGGGQSAAGETTETKRTIFNDDIVLLIPRGAPGASGGSIEITDIGTEQDW